VNITVLMSVHNTPPSMLARAVESIRTQTWTNFEFLILDDGSTADSTRAYLIQLATARDCRIRLYFEPHRGLTPTLNRGLALAKGDFIARQDSDDWSEPDRLERQTAYLEAHPDTGLLGSAAWTHQQDETPLWKVRMPENQVKILEAFQRGNNPFVHGSVMFPAAAAQALGGYREELPCSQDYDFLWRLTETAGATNLAEPLYHYRYSAISVSAMRAVEQARAHRATRILARARRRGEPEDVAKAFAGCSDLEERCARAAAALKQADHMMLAGDYRRAFRAYRTQVWSRPQDLLGWAKLARLGLFSVSPPLRRWSFR
jgi:glycosyltransferase involved in cell wall biosynthesis